VAYGGLYIWGYAYPIRFVRSGKWVLRRVLCLYFAAQNTGGV